MLLHHFEAIANLIIFGFLMKVVFTAWAANTLTDYFNSWFVKKFVRTERQVAIWLHWQKRAKKEGHHPRNVLNCTDEDCKNVTPVRHL